MLSGGATGKRPRAGPGRPPRTRRSAPHRAGAVVAIHGPSCAGALVRIHSEGLDPVALPRLVGRIPGVCPDPELIPTRAARLWWDFVQGTTIGSQCRFFDLVVRPVHGSLANRPRTAIPNVQDLRHGQLPGRHGHANPGVLIARLLARLAGNEVLSGVAYAVVPRPHHGGQIETGIRTRGGEQDDFIVALHAEER